MRDKERESVPAQECQTALRSMRWLVGKSAAREECMRTKTIKKNCMQEKGQISRKR